MPSNNVLKLRINIARLIEKRIFYFFFYFICIFTFRFEQGNKFLKRFYAVKKIRLAGKIQPTDIPRNYYAMTIFVSSKILQN
ncbi:hypothetical protein CSQ91_06815 [Janthinobacterium sp. BJB301]|nr:hypothetical protein CSQ91_06815 [Janthinobacterium sp. BJB301]